MAPVSQSIEVRCDGMLALSLTDNGGNSISSGDVGEGGDFEICSDKKDYWDEEW